VAALAVFAYVRTRHSLYSSKTRGSSFSTSAFSRPGIAGSSTLPLLPDFSFTEIDGHSVRASSYKGKVLLVNFWAAWCVPCAAETPQFIALEKKYGPEGLQVIGFSVDDDPQELRDFYRKHQINYPVAPSDDQIAAAFGGVFGLPTTFLVTRQGRIHSRHNGAMDFTAIEQEALELLDAKEESATEAQRKN
jgi:thiol-disulfide isomerase/thioredoxin